MESKVIKDDMYPISTWLNIINSLIPANGVLIVGAGTGNSPWVQWLHCINNCHGWLVEGDKAQFQLLKRSASLNKNLTLLNKVVNDNLGPVKFHHASNPTENGLLSPKTLYKIWPKLECDNIENLDTTITLSSLFEDAKNTINWLILDCLPAVTLLMGSGQHLQSLDVIIVRVVLDEFLDNESGAGFNSTEKMLTAAGFSCVQILPQRHPAIIYAMYSRNYKKLKLEFESSNHELKKLKETLSHKDEFAGMKEIIKDLYLQISNQDETIKSLKEELISRNNIRNDVIGLENFIEDIEPFIYGKSITYVDVGAFTGEIFKSIINSKKIRIREAHLIEPNPNSYENLIFTLEGLKIPSLHTYNMGISDSEETLRFLTSASMTKVIASAQSDITPNDYIDIKCSRLDNFSHLFTDRKIDLLKIDVEGHEMAVLKGSENLLQKSLIDIIYIEVGFNISGTQQTYFGEIDKFLQSFGYRCFRIYEQTNEWIIDSPWLRRCNFAYFSSPFSHYNPVKLTLENRRLNKIIKDNHANFK